MPHKTVSLRHATKADIPAMASTIQASFDSSRITKFCFPPGRETDDFYFSLVSSGVSAADPNTHWVVAEAEGTELGGESHGTDENATKGGKKILAWAKWVRMPTGHDATPYVPLTPALFPSSGNPELAAQSFNLNKLASRRHAGSLPHWFLSVLVVRPEAQRRGFGSALLRYGLDLADAESLPAYLNASEDGKPLYLRFGFKVLDVSTIEGVWEASHMLRDAVPKKE